MQDDKRQHRQLKRDIKRAGSKHRRRDFKRQIQEDPDEAHTKEENFGRYSSAGLNAHDSDATRRKPKDEEE